MTPQEYEFRKLCLRKCELPNKIRLQFEKEVKEYEKKGDKHD